MYSGRYALMTFENPPCPADDRRIDHPALKGKRTGPLRAMGFKRGDERVGTINLFGCWREFFIQNFDLARMDTRRSLKAQLASPADPTAEYLRFVVNGN